jgi:hypothetical protein
MIQEGMKSVALLVVLLAACGGEHTHIFPDARTTDAAPDASSLGDCDYVEQRDATNDDVSSMTDTPEVTGLTIGTKTTICGTFDAGHFDGDVTVDIDGYAVFVAKDTDVFVRITGSGADTIELVGVDVYTGTGLATHVGANTYYGDHGVTAVHLTPGTYELVPFALNSTEITASVPYRVIVDPDNPATRCVELTSGGFTEGTADNDVIAFPASGGPMLTPAPTDSPEATGIMLGDPTRIAGTATDIANQDNYEDRDTFAFATNASTNEATLMLKWAGAADLNFYLFEADKLDPIVPAITTTAGSETALTSLKPSTNYWFVVGAKTGSTGLPASYSATICGAHY